MIMFMVTTMRDAIIAPHLLLQTFYARKENVSQLRSIKYQKTFYYIFLPNNLICLKLKKYLLL